MSIDREAFAKAVSEKSPLSLNQIERLFGVVGEQSKAVVWRFLNMTKAQQDSIWQAHVRIGNADPEIKATVESVE